MNLVLWCVCKCSHHHITSHSFFFCMPCAFFPRQRKDFGMQQADTNKQDFRESNVSAKSQITFSEAWMSLLQDSSINLTCFTSTAVFSHFKMLCNRVIMQEKTTQRSETACLKSDLWCRRAAYANCWLKAFIYKWKLWCSLQCLLWTDFCADMWRKPLNYCL